MSADASTTNSGTGNKVVETTLRLRADSGNSAVADEKNVAKKSSSIVDRMSGDVKTNFNPSMAARSDTSSAGASASRSGRPLTPRISNSARMTQPNDSAFTTYTQPTPATFTVGVNTELKVTAHAPIPGFTDGTTRSVAAVADGEGGQATFVENELVVMSDDPGAVKQLLARRGGKVRSMFADPQAAPRNATFDLLRKFRLPLGTKLPSTSAWRSGRPTGTLRIVGACLLDLACFFARRFFEPRTFNEDIFGLHPIARRRVGQIRNP